MNSGVGYNMDLRSKFTSVVGLAREGLVGEALYWSFKKSTVGDVDQRSKNSVENTLRKKDSGCSCCDEEFKSLAIAIAMGAPTLAATVAKAASNATTATVEATTVAANTKAAAASVFKNDRECFQLPQFCCSFEYN